MEGRCPNAGPAGPLRPHFLTPVTALPLTARTIEQRRDLAALLFAPPPLCLPGPKGCPGDTRTLGLSIPSGFMKFQIIPLMASRPSCLGALPRAKPAHPAPRSDGHSSVLPGNPTPDSQSQCQRIRDPPLLGAERAWPLLTTTVSARWVCKGCPLSRPQPPLAQATTLAPVTPAQESLSPHLAHHRPLPAGHHMTPATLQAAGRTLSASSIP